MSLKKKHGVTLRLASQNRVGLTSILHQDQRGHQWCWAACISMVLQGLGHPLKQCDLAGMVLPTICPSCANPCFQGKAYPKCDKPYPIEGIEALWKEEFIKVQSDPPQRPLSWEGVIEELGNGHALEILLGWSDDGGHLVLMIDAVLDSDGSAKKILVADPSSNVRDVSPKDFDSALKELQWGKWRWTWTGLHF